MDRIYQLAKALTDIPTVSGREDMGLERIAEIAGKYFDEHYFTPLNSFIGIKRCGKKNAKMLLLDAHLDEIGFTVTEILSGGFLRVCKNGGPDPRTLSASDVYVYGSERIKGVFTSKPPHLQEPKESEKPLTVDDFFIDTGLSDEECRRLVSVGAPAGLRGSCERLMGDRLVGKGFDDKICIAAILIALEKLVGERQIDIACQFTANEETGYKGAVTASCFVKPDWAIALDVTHAYVAGNHESGAGCVMGGGGELCYSGTTHVPFTRFICDVAEKHGIPYQACAAGNRTGSNTNAVYIGSGGAPTALLSVPLKNMHTASEIVSERDVELVAQLLNATITELEGGAF